MSYWIFCLNSSVFFSIVLGFIHHFCLCQMWLYIAIYWRKPCKSSFFLRFSKENSLRWIQTQLYLYTFIFFLFGIQLHHNYVNCLATSQLHELFFIIVKSGNYYNKKVYIKMSYTSLVMDYCIGFSKKNWHYWLIDIHD